MHTRTDTWHMHAHVHPPRHMHRYTAHAPIHDTQHMHRNTNATYIQRSATNSFSNNHSIIVKLGRLTKIAPLYRGWTGATLPRSFFEPDELGLCGGVEYGFSSTTTERHQAMHYAQGKASTILELEMGMVDRGADIGARLPASALAPGSPAAGPASHIHDPAAHLMGTTARQEDILYTCITCSLNLYSLSLSFIALFLFL